MERHEVDILTNLLVSTAWLDTNPMVPGSLRPPLPAGPSGRAPSCSSADRRPQLGCFSRVSSSVRAREVRVELLVYGSQSFAGEVVPGGELCHRFEIMVLSAR